MSVVKQSGVRNHKSKGFKVKHVVHICLLLALCTWLLNQARQSYDKYHNPFADPAAIESRTPPASHHKGIKLGRKDLDTQVQMPALEHVDAGEEMQADEEVEENKNEETDQEKTEDEESEETEDLIDEDDQNWETQVGIASYSQTATASTLKGVDSFI